MAVTFNKATGTAPLTLALLAVDNTWVIPVHVFIESFHCVSNASDVANILLLPEPVGEIIDLT